MGLSVWGGRLAVVFQTGELMVSAPKPKKSFTQFDGHFLFKAFAKNF
jgi:hypothetical protein